MAMEISALTKVDGLSQAFPAQEAQATQANPAVGFGTFLEEMVSKVNAQQMTADKSIQAMATGEGKGLHEVMLAVEKANISFQLLTQVRNKAVEAYQEIMRMPV